MPLLPIALLLLLPIVIVLMMPLALVQRYRLGKARRLARGWVATVNFIGMLVSAGIFLWAAALTNFWVPQAFIHALLGLLGGSLLGLLGLALTRWEETPRTLHYTPNRWLVLTLTLAVSARLLYGFWRGWHAWRTTQAANPWLAEAGVAGSLAVGAVVLGYYLAYSAGVSRRLRRQRQKWTP